MNQIIANMIIRAVMKLPMNGYGTYVINGAGVVGWLVYAAFTFDFSTALGAIALHLGMIFQRRSTDKQSDKLLYVESLLQQLTDAATQQPTGPEADTRPR